MSPQVTDPLTSMVPLKLSKRSAVVTAAAALTLSMPPSCTCRLSPAFRDVAEPSAGVVTVSVLPLTITSWPPPAELTLMPRLCHSKW